MQLLDIITLTSAALVDLQILQPFSHNKKSAAQTNITVFFSINIT